MKKNIVIVGLGLIGGSLAKAISSRTEHIVTGIDVSPDVMETALSGGAIHHTGTPDSLREAEIIFLCIYPEAAVSFITEYGHLIPKGCLVADTCGIKEEICRHMPLLAERFGFTFIGCHPMAGKEKSGFSASEAELFQGASFIIVPCGAPEEAVKEIEGLALRLGFGGTVITTPERHDRMIAFTSQLPHILACAYVMSPQCLMHNGFSAGSYRDVSRVARINEVLWTELFLDNAKPLTEELDLLIENITALRDAVAEGRRDDLRGLLRKGRLIKEQLGE